MTLALAVAEKKPKGKPGPKPDPAKPIRTATFNLRSTQAWKDWLFRYAEHRGIDAADLIDNSLLYMAREDGFEMPPKR